MGCHAGMFEAGPFVEAGPKIIEHEKSLPRKLIPGLFYKELTPLVQSKDVPGAYEPITTPGQEICAMTVCDEDFCDKTEPTYVGVLIRGCVNADFVCWPESFTPEDCLAYEDGCNCCILIQRPIQTCPPMPEEDDCCEAKTDGKENESLAA